MSTLPHSLLRTGLFGLATGFAHSAHAADPISVYFLHESQEVRESGSTKVYLEMTTYPLTTVVIPFRIVDAESTATRQTLNEDEELTEGDYYLAEDDDPDDGNGFLFDPVTGEGSFTIIGYPARRPFPTDIVLSGDDLPEENETIVIEIDEGGLVGLTTHNDLKKHTITIIDDDSPDADSSFKAHAYFESSALFVDEGDSLSVPVRLLAPSTHARRLNWRIVYGEADASDLNFDEDDETPFSVDINAGGTVATIPLVITSDILVEGTETFQIELISMEYLDEDGTPTTTGSFIVDTSPLVVTIYDDDPTTVQFDFSGYLEENWNGITLTEGEDSQYSIIVTLSNPVEYPVEIPLVIGGTATRGTSDEEDGTDWYPAPDPADDDETVNDVITIAAGSTSYTMTMVILNDILIEEDGQTVTFGLGTPQMVITTENSSGNDVETREPLPLGTPDDGDGYVTSYTVTIDDNDPVDIGFGKSNPALLLEDPDEDEPAFIADAELIAAESAGGVTVPVYASSVVAVSGTFEIEVLSDGTDAKMADVNQALSEQDWDFYVAVGNTYIENLDEPTEGTIPTGRAATGISIVFNNDDEPALPYRHFAAWAGGAIIPDEDGVELSMIEQEETIRLRLTEITNFDDSGLILRETSDATDGINPREITVRIREMPDIDVTEEFTGVAPADDNFVDGNPPRNAKTRLHELHFELAPTSTLIGDFSARRGTAANEYADGDGTLNGYTHYKLAIQPGLYDLDNPEDTSNDPLRPRVLSSGQITIWEPDGYTSYFRLVIPRFSPRFANGFDLITLREGIEKPDNRPAFFEENAPIMTMQPYISQPLNFGQLDPVPEILREGHADLEDSMDYLIEFSNNGFHTFSAEERAKRLANTRVLLTRTSDTSSSGTSFSGSILGFEEYGEDKDILLELYNPNGSFLRIEYMDATGEDAGVWKTAQPGVFYGTGTNFFWIDQGPPKTDKHPSEVDFRLYRISN